MIQRSNRPALMTTTMTFQNLNIVLLGSRTFGFLLQSCRTIVQSLWEPRVHTDSFCKFLIPFCIQNKTTVMEWKTSVKDLLTLVICYRFMSQIVFKKCHKSCDTTIESLNKESFKNVERLRDWPPLSILWVASIGNILATFPQW